MLNVSQAASNNGFFNSLVSGTNLDQYQSVFQNAECTGCTYEMFKAASVVSSSPGGDYGLRWQTVYHSSHSAGKH